MKASSSGRESRGRPPAPPGPLQSSWPATTSSCLPGCCSSAPPGGRTRPSLNSSQVSTSQVTCCMLLVSGSRKEENDTSGHQPHDTSTTSNVHLWLLQKMLINSSYGIIPIAAEQVNTVFGILSSSEQPLFCLDVTEPYKSLHPFFSAPAAPILGMRTVFKYHNVHKEIRVSSGRPLCTLQLSLRHCTTPAAIISLSVQRPTLR